jgi:choline dehydrogenase-like flavoprotein
MFHPDAADPLLQPRITSANIQAAVYALAERGADIIKADK